MGTQILCCPNSISENEFKKDFMVSHEKKIGEITCRTFQVKEYLVGLSRSKSSTFWKTIKKKYNTEMFWNYHRKPVL